MLRIIQILTLFMLFYSGLAQSSDAAVGLTVTPRDADVYVNGELKANKTPVVIRLQAGAYQFQVKKAGWQPQEFPVVLAEGVIMPKLEIKLVAVPPPPAVDPQALIATVRDPFETEAEFATRRLGIMQQFNTAAATGDLRYKAGTARLNKDGYNIDTQIFPLNITWSPWATQFGLPTNGSIHIPREQALSLWQKGPEQPIFLLFDPALAKVKAFQVILWGLQKQWNAYIGTNIHNSYLMLEDGTAIDVKTGLMWKRCSEGQVWDGSTCTGESSMFTWNDAMPNDQQKTWNAFAGYDDWRVPTKEELHSLVWCSNGTTQEDAWNNGCTGQRQDKNSYQLPTLDINVFPNTRAAWFWSSSAYDSISAWYVGFGYGDVYGSIRANGSAVRLVRGGQ